VLTIGEQKIGCVRNPTPDWQANIIFKEKGSETPNHLIAKEKVPTRDNVTKNLVTRNAAHIHTKVAKSTKQSL
jgi:hypothetical protein